MKGMRLLGSADSDDLDDSADSADLDDLDDLDVLEGLDDLEGLKMEQVASAIPVSEEELNRHDRLLGELTSITGSLAATVSSKIRFLVSTFGQGAAPATKARTFASKSAK